MEPSKYKKLVDYAAFLEAQAQSEQKNKEYTEAIPHYLKTVDVLLVMADASPDYPSWVNCTDRANSIQKKIKSLIALAALEQEKKESGTSSEVAGAASIPKTNG